MNKLMINSQKTRLSRKLTGLRLLPYVAVGGLIFYFNSTTDFNYLLRGYFVLLEAQAGILFVYFITGKLQKSQGRSS